jgi:hypothetical protein
MRATSASASWGSVAKPLQGAARAELVSGAHTAFCADFRKSQPAISWIIKYPGAGNRGQGSDIPVFGRMICSTSPR